MKKKIEILTGLFTFIIISSIGCTNIKQNIDKQETTITNNLENQSQDGENNDKEESSDFYIIKEAEIIDDADDNKKVKKTYEDYPFMSTMSTDDYVYYDLISNEYIELNNNGTNLFIGWKIGQLLSFIIKTDDVDFENSIGDITETEIILPFVQKYNIPFNWKTNEYDELVIEYNLNDDGTLELTNNGNTICFEISKDKKLTKEYEKMRKDTDDAGLCVD